MENNAQSAHPHYSAFLLTHKVVMNQKSPKQFVQRLLIQYTTVIIEQNMRIERGDKLSALLV